MSRSTQKTPNQKLGIKPSLFLLSKNPALSRSKRVATTLQPKPRLKPFKTKFPPKLPKRLELIIIISKTKHPNPKNETHLNNPTNPIGIPYGGPNLYQGRKRRLQYSALYLGWKISETRKRKI